MAFAAASSPKYDVYNPEQVAFRLEIWTRGSDQVGQYL
jgi:hypothetical protein